MCRFHLLHALSWNHFEAFHKPFVLLRCYRFDLAYVPGPSELAIGEPLVKQQKSIAFIEQTFYSIRSSAAEKEQISLLKGIHPELLLDQAGESVDPSPQISIAARYIYMLETGRIIEHSSVPPGP